MATVSLATLSIDCKLQAAGLPEDQAEAITTASRESRDADLATLARRPT